MSIQTTSRSSFEKSEWLSATISTRLRYIQSEPGRGYMFVAELQSEEHGPGDHARGEAPLFINRGAELAQLNDAFDSVRACDRRMVVITGPSGIGKTALADTFIRTIRSMTPARWRSVNASCIAAPWSRCIRCSTPSSVWGGSFLRYCRRSLEHAPSWVQQFPRWCAQIRSVRPGATNQYAVTDSSAATDAADMIAEFCSFVEALAQETPLVLCLDDFQLADAATIKALEVLAGRASRRNCWCWGRRRCRMRRRTRNGCSGC